MGYSGRQGPKLASDERVWWGESPKEWKAVPVRTAGWKLLTRKEGAYSGNSVSRCDGADCSCVEEEQVEWIRPRQALHAGCRKLDVISLVAVSHGRSGSW